MLLVSYVNVWLIILWVIVWLLDNLVGWINGMKVFFLIVNCVILLLLVFIIILLNFFEVRVVFID